MVVGLLLNIALRVRHWHVALEMRTNFIFVESVAIVKGCDSSPEHFIIILVMVTYDRVEAPFSSFSHVKFATIDDNVVQICGQIFICIFMMT